MLKPIYLHCVLTPVVGSLSMATPEQTPDTVTTNTNLPTQSAPEQKPQDSDSDGDDGLTILAILEITKDYNGNWGVVQQQPAVSSMGAAMTQDEMTTGGWSSTDEDNEWVDRFTEVPKLQAKHMGRRLKNKKLKKPDVN